MTGVSTLGQQLTLISRIKTIQSDMAKYQQQITTGVKHQSFKDYGTAALTIQRYRADLVNLDGYMKNISIVQTKIRQMETAMSETMAQADNVLYAIDIELAKGQGFNMESISDIANTALQLVEANMNVREGDRYLFAGTDVSNIPYEGGAILASNLQGKVQDWLDGTISTNDFVNQINALSDSELGYSPTLQNAGKVVARASDTFEVDYTVKADDTAFRKIMIAMNVLSQLQKPNPDIDMATNDQFHSVVNDMYQMMQDGIVDMRKNMVKIAAASETLNTVNINHKNDQQSLRQLMEETEAADDSEAGILFLNMQSQLEASYRVTAMVSQLSLTKYLSF